MSSANLNGWSLAAGADSIFSRYKLVRGAIDFGGVVNRMKKRSKYGG